MGGTRENTLNANNGRDVIIGLGGNDTLIGGRGSDSCNGGVGTDTETTCET